MQKDESETLRREETCPRPHRGKRRCRGGRWFPRLLQRGGGERGGRVRGEGRPALPLRSPSSLLAVRLLQGSPGRPDHRCRPRSLVGVARPAPTSPPSRNHVTAGSRACSQTGSRRQRSARGGREPPLKRRRAGWPCSFSGSVALPTVRQKLTAQTWKSQEGPQTSVRRGPTSREKWAAVILLSNWA